MFDEKEIEQLCTQNLAFLSAQRLYVTGAVKNLREEEAEVSGEYYIEGDVQESGEEYYVWLRYRQKEGVLLSYECECREFWELSGMCRHCAALALEYLEQRKSRARLEAYTQGLMEARRVRSDPVILKLVQKYAVQQRLQAQEATGEINLIPELHEKGWNYYYGRKSYALSFRIGAADGRQYVVKNLTAFVECVEQEENFTYGKKLSFVHCKSMFSPEGWAYVELIQDAVRLRSAKSEQIEKLLPLTRATMERFLELNLGKKITYDCIGSNFHTLSVWDQNPPVQLSLLKTEGGFALELPALTLLRGEMVLYVRMRDVIYRCTEEYRKAMEPVLDCTREDRPVVCQIAEEDMRSFCAAVAPSLVQQQSLSMEEALLEKYRPRRAELSYYLDEESGIVTLKAECRYGAETFLLSGSEQEKPWPHTGIAAEYRDRLRERRALETARAYFPYQDQENGLLFFETKEQDRMYQLLDTGLQQLEEQGKVYATDRFQAHTLIRKPKTQVGISLNGGLLELTVDSEAFSGAELFEILESYRRKKSYHRLRSGAYLKLQDNTAQDMAELLLGLHLSKKQLAGKIIQVPKFRACYIEDSLKKSRNGLQSGQNGAYKELIESMARAEEREYLVPELLKDTLRPYQVLGYRWLRTLAQFGFGGILADEMGLGKTLQVITYLLARSKEGEAVLPSLIVCPASLVYNWKRELERFAPELAVQLLVGSAAQREEVLHSEAVRQKLQRKKPESADGARQESIKEPDGGTAAAEVPGSADGICGAEVWITSYDMLKRDIEQYHLLRFDTEILDEAQNIKNQDTQAAKAVKGLQAKVRFALTGTPIENRLSELWSIFDYLMPGFLETYEQFRRNYEIPIVQEQDRAAAGRLRQLAAPFILRRLKREVLKDLPDKLEQIVYSQMEEEQRKLYVCHVQALQEQLAGKSKEEIRKEQLQILAELTRLRQLCCDPSLVYENYEAGACKVDTCMELVRQAVWSSQKVLIFSQFTSIFPILEKRLAQEDIRWYELTGRTPKEERLQMTEAFNEDDTPVFLISLKAGGTGLNLTAASIVIHFEPWWNLAAQNQATDRAHRIGQKNQVAVFKLIAQDTIEENIVGLQEQKKELAGQILAGSQFAQSSFSREEFLELLKL